ncbi:flagellar basal body-associated FliL family protein [Aureimonas psammosilenae]|uniref:flagellar basal body-associated FliL family protein n=1 Tax=Aureimonas psammosilenae TaxID=2495496 RepID=UPI001260D0C4|nr:flagellar basal body-associated FliL family protein [Aureimonas psammosilenae]
MTDLSADALIAQATGAAEQPKKSGLVSTIVPIAILTLVAIGGGATVGWMVGGQSAERAEEALKAEAKTAAPPAEEATPAETPDAIVKLPPIITNIGSPSSAIIRIQASIVYRKADVADPAVLAAEVESDTLAFLRTVDIVQIEGARGYLHLKEDLAERARVRSPAIKDYLIESLVAQ